MDYPLFFSIFILGALLIFAVFFFVELKNTESKLTTIEARILAEYVSRIDKIPALVEVIQQYANDPEIYTDIVKLHRNAIVGSTRRIYDMLELNARISSAFNFLMRLAIRIRPLATNGNFLYTRDFWIFSEKAMAKDLEEYDRMVYTYEKLRKMKNQTIFGLLLPAKEYIRVRNSGV